jgi:phosphonatase-like hydrolase
MAEIKLVVFDMAGTTVDENNVVYKTLQTAITEKVHDVSLEKVLELGAGKEKKQAIIDILREIAPETPAALIDETYHHFVKLLDAAYSKLDVKPQNYTIEILRWLRDRNIRTALNTGYSRPVAENLIVKLGWIEGVDFDLLVTASDVSKARPEPDMIVLAKQKLGIEADNQIVKVGDSIIDIEEGKNANCGLTIGITSGAHSLEQLLTAKPDFVIDGLEVLKEILK